MFTPISSYGLSMRMPIPYLWCDYAQGRTAKRPSGARDVLTGFMSGCPIVRFNQGGFHVGHVGTVESAAVNLLVKTGARQFLANVQSVTGFFPAAAWATDQIPMAQKHKGNSKVVALVTGAGEFYSILMLQDMHQLEEWVCGGAKKVPPLDYNALRTALQ